MNKGTFFEEFFSESINSVPFDNLQHSTDSDEDTDMGKRILTFGNNKETTPSKTTYDSESISSSEFKDVAEDSDQAENDEIKEILQEEFDTDTNVFIDWKYNPDNIKESEWEFAYKILTNMKLKEHFVKTTWNWDNNLSLQDDFTDTLNSAIVYALVTLVNPVNLQLQVYKIVCKIPKKEARKMYKLNLTIPSHDWVLRANWSWLSCIPYKNDNEATV